MTYSPSTMTLRAVFKFPFRSPNWSNRFLIGTVLFLANMFIPILPSIFVYGYIVQVMRQSIKGEDLVLPEWKNWGELAVDGLRGMIVGIVYLAPGIITLVGGWLLYMLMWFSGMILMPESSESFPINPVVLMFGAMAVLFISMFIGWFLSIIGVIPLPLAIAHFVARDRLGAAFNIKEWWAILKADKWGYFIGWVVTMGLAMVLYYIVMLVYFTGILCFLINFIAAPIILYVLLIAAAIFGQIYRESVAQLANEPAKTNAQ